MEIFLQSGSIVVLIIAICQGIKRAGISSRYIPIIAIVLGIIGAVYFDGVNWLATASGIILSLIAQGLYSGFKRTVLNK